jgi:hypothetical protein
MLPPTDHILLACFKSSSELLIFEKMLKFIYFIVIVFAVRVWLQLILVYINDTSGPGVNSASNRNEYQVHFVGVKMAGA